MRSWSRATSTLTTLSAFRSIDLNVPQATFLRRPAVILTSSSPSHNLITNTEAMRAFPLLS